MKNRPLTLVGAFLLLIVAIVVAVGNFKKPEHIQQTNQTLASQQVTQQHMLKPHVRAKTPLKPNHTLTITTKAMMGSQKTNTEQ